MDSFNIDKSGIFSMNNDFIIIYLMQVSAALNHNVDTLLVGVVRQIRLRQPENLAKNMSEYDDQFVDLKTIDMAKP